MRSLLLHSAVLCCCLLGLEGSFVEQTPRFAAVSPGSTEFIRCTLKDREYPWMSWYLQDANGQLENLFVIRTTGDKEKLDRKDGTYEAVRVSDTELTLRIDNTSVSQIIYCTCSSPTNNEKLYFGAGTRLTVLEKDVPVREPKVVLFDPSEQEIRQKKKATLVCLASNFYPGFATITWSVNGVNRTEGVQTDDDPTRDVGNQMYSMTSRLRLSKREWFNSWRTFQCTVHIYHPEEKDIPMETRGREECGITEDSYKRQATLAKITYILLLCKAALHGLVVTFLAWTFKVNDKHFS